jgi:biopolymer transport protein TolR
MAFSTNGTSGGDSLSSEINVTPLIDVLLVMLIIFMVIMPVVPNGLNSAILGAAKVETVDEARESPILIQVTQGATAVQYWIDGAGLESDEITPRLREILSRKSARQVLLKADAKLDFGMIAEVIDAGQAAGAESVGIVTPRTDTPSK